MNNALGYPDAVWQRFREAPNAGRMDDASTVAAQALTPGSGFRLRLVLRVDDGLIADARFQAFGCPYTLATGSWLAQWLIGRTVAELATPPIAELRAALEIPEERAHCWLMAQDVLRDLHRQLS